MAENQTSTCETSYSGKSNLSNGQLNFLVTFDVVVMVLNIVTNIVVILSLVATKQLKNNSLKLILYLSISDCCLAVITQPLFAAMLTNFADRSYCNFETVVQFFAILFTHTSGYTIAVIGYDRYARMKYLNRYSQVVTDIRIKCTLALVWMSSLIQALVYVCGTQLNFFAKAKKVTVGIDAVIALSVLLFYVMTIRVIRNYRNHAENRQVLKGVDKVVTRLASKILLSIIVFYISYVIISLTHSALISKYQHTKKRWLEFSLFVGYILTYCNSFVNALIFLGVNKPAKERLKRLCGKSIDQDTNERNATSSTEEHPL